MAIFLNNNVGFKLNTVDLSDHVTSFTLNRSVDQVEVTAMGDTAHKFVAGLASDTLTVSFLNDTAVGSVLATLQDNYGATVTWGASQRHSSISNKQTLYRDTFD